MIEPLTFRETRHIHGRIVTATDLAAARQQLAHEGCHLPRWDELADHDQFVAALEAAGWLRALGQIAPSADTTETSTQWTMRVRYTHGGQQKDGQPMDKFNARMAVDGLNQDENADWRARERIDRAELVSREVHTTADGWTHTGPWTSTEEES